MNEKYKKSITILFCIVLPLFLLLLSYKTVLFFTSLTSAQEEVFLFLDGKQELSTEFTELERSHLEDVKEVMMYADYVLYVLLLTLALVITYYKKQKDFVLKLFEYGGKTTIAAMLLLGMLSFLFFDALFTIFHQIFFPQGNWQFAADSLLIQTFPLEFFVTISRNIFLLTILLGILFILLEYSYHHVRGNRN